MNKLLDVTGISRRYPMQNGHVTVFEDLSVSLDQGEFLAVTGVSGVGKSTLLNLVGLLDRPDGGEITLQGTPYSALTADEASLFRNQKIGFVFQFHHLLPEFTVLENVAIPYAIGNGAFDRGLEKAKELLDAVGLHDRLDHFPAMLSGGEQQRTAIARSLINSPSLLLMDEPTGNLDPATGDRVMDVLEALRNKRSFGCILVTHNMKIAGRCDRIFPIRRNGEPYAGEVLG